MAAIATEATYPVLTLGWREQVHGRRFAEFDIEALTSYCTECLVDVTNNIDEQKWHVCSSDTAHVDAAAVILARRLAGPAPAVVRPCGEMSGRPIVSAAVPTWQTKAEAVKAARSAGYPEESVAKVTTRFRWSWGIVERHPSGLVVLTREGLADAIAAHAAGHRTRTYEIDRGERYITKSNGSCGRYVRQYNTAWLCTCGNGGYGNDRDRASAQANARAHREDPNRFPGIPREADVYVVAGAS